MGLIPGRFYKKDRAMYRVQCRGRGAPAARRCVDSPPPGGHHQSESSVHELGGATVMRHLLRTMAVAFVATLVAPSLLFALESETAIVYREPGRFGGWPANHGMWSWGNELLVGFSAGYFKDNGPTRHAIDHDRPEEHLLARSIDGGQTWKIENPAEQGALIPRGEGLHGTELPRVVDRPWIDCPGGIDFTHPDFAMTLRMSDNHGGASRFYYSTDRGHHWQGPFRFPDAWAERDRRAAPITS